VDARILQSTSDRETLHADIPWKDERLLLRTFLWKENQDHKHGWQLKFKIGIWFCGQN
jgi:hypothetical protein